MEKGSVHFLSFAFLVLLMIHHQFITCTLSPKQKLDLLREEMQKHSIYAYIIPTSDSHMSEYVSSSDQRRAFISGFDGSAGTAVVTLDSALLWADGRYWKQAENQVDSNYWKVVKSIGGISIPAWLSENLKTNQSVGVDPSLYSVSKLETRIFLTFIVKDEFRSLQKSANSVKIIYENLVDLVWEDRPKAPNGSIFELGIEFSGQSTSDKLSNVRTAMKSKNVNCYIVTALDEIAWFLNLRGSDIEYNTVFFSYLIITMDEVRFYVDKAKIKDTDIEKQLESLKISVLEYSSYINDVSEITQQSNLVFIDPSYCNYATYSSIKSESIQEGTSFIRFDKAIKNQVEREGFKNCEIRDGIAIVRYLAWLENEIKHGRTINKFDGAIKLESYRAEESHFLRSSFETISAYGENAAIVHYAPTRDNHADIGTDNVYLLDSGGQYLDGTTDTTRTVHFGIPSERVKRTFTRVLQGLLGLSSLIFPSGLAGDKMDPLARAALWKEGLSYNHGTGHGVGHCLDVHEGPHGIGVAGFGFKEHYDVTIEPGYYEIGNFGIRIENLYLVRKSQTPNNFENKTYLEFEQITYCPIQPSLVDVSLLNENELKALNDYNSQVWEKLSPLLTNDLLALDYLKRNTQPLSNGSNTTTTFLTIALVSVLVILTFSVVGNIYLAFKIKKQPKKGHHHSDGELQALSEGGY